MRLDDIFRMLQEQQQQESESENKEPEPEIAKDRLVSPGPLHLCLVFKRCQHHHHIPTYLLDEMGSHREIVEFINSRQCPDCIQEWAEMERSLTAEYQRFVKNRGKL